MKRIALKLEMIIFWETAFLSLARFLTANYAKMMDPAEVEFLAEKELIAIVPNFSQDKIYLIGVSIILVLT